MKPKIIVADDSLTIQKVIKITLANEDFDLVECLDESSLTELIKENSPIVALLDFNLSENKTGYDLAREIRSLGVAKVFMLYGTFDTVDEKLLEHSGASAHIVKPFEGTKFINQCRQLVEDVSLEESDPGPNIIPDAEEEVISEFPEPIVDEDDQWVVNQPEIVEAEEVEDEFVSDEIISVKEMDSLQAGMKEWGIDVPGIIGNTEEKEYALADLPPVIEDEVIEESADNFVENTSNDEDKDTVEIETKDDSTDLEIESTLESAVAVEEEALPPSEDLEYPDIDMIKSSVEAEISAPKSKLVSIAELAEENTEEVIDDTAGTRTEEEVRDLEAQIADEVVEDNFWTADEVVEDPSVTQEEVKAETEVEIESPLSEKEEDSQEQDTETISENKIEEVKFDLAELDQDKILEMIEPIVEKMVEQRVQEILEKVAWEVIPDLSENLIKKELEKISEQIINLKK